jgi:hypothetical protein
VVAATAPITYNSGTQTISTSLATNKLLGRSTAGTGVAEEITIGSGLSLTAGTLSSTGGGGGSGTPGGTNTQIQFNNAGAFGGDADLTWNSTTNVLGVTGDVNLSDGGTYTTTFQTITPTADRTISLPDATGTVALVAGSSGQLLWNNAGVNAGASTLTYDGSILTTSGRFINSYSSVSLAPAKAFTGTWATGFGATNTKPHLLIEPTGTTSTGWSTSGTGLGVNAASGFGGNLLDLQVNGSRKLNVASDGSITITNTATTRLVTVTSPTSGTAHGFTHRYDDNALIYSYSSSNGGISAAGQGIRQNFLLGTSGNVAFRAYLDIVSTTTNGSDAAIVFGTGGTPAERLRITSAGIISFGGTTSSFPALKQSSAILQARLADDSGYTTIDAQLRAQGTAPANATATGTAGDVRYDTDYVYICTATNTWKRAALTTW